MAFLNQELLRTLKLKLLTKIASLTTRSTNVQPSRPRIYPPLSIPKFPCLQTGGVRLDLRVLASNF